jgi:ribosomal protein S18 acetylase RimI-like enzyme
VDKIAIRKCKKSDENSIIDICYKTGYMGEDLTDRNIFNDIKLFGYLFCSYYCLYETGNSFVAVDESKNNKVIGYIIGTLNSKRQEKLFVKKMFLKIAIRLFLCDSWKYRESYNAVMFFIKNINLKHKYDSLYTEYPAHLHINILPQYQHYGVGSRLIGQFENHVRENNISGIHLRTSNKNIKAVPFYKRKGYKVINENHDKVWKDAAEYKNIIFAKKV